MKTLSITIALVAVMVGVSCSDSETGTITTVQKNVQDDQRHSSVPTTNLALSDLRAYYDETVFRINLIRLSRLSSAAAFDSGMPICKIFTVAELSQPQPFHLVLDSNNNGAPFVYCLAHLIKFENDAPPRQFYSMSSIEDAIDSGEITVENTERLYKCVFL